MKRAKTAVWSVAWPLRLLWWFVSWPFIDYFECLYPLNIYREAKELDAALKHATTYEEWSSHARRLDHILPKLHAWKHDMRSPYYYYNVVDEKLSAVDEVIGRGNITNMESLLRTGVRRYYFDITDARLFDQLYGGTKALIEHYINAVLELLDHLIERWKSDLTTRERMKKMQKLHISTQRTALILQGGSLFGLFHLGVIRELNQQSLLPKVIIGTGTGAVTAGLVAALTDEELEEFADNPNIITDAFEPETTAVKAGEVKGFRSLYPSTWRWFNILKTRITGMYASRGVLDREALQRLVDMKLGDMTFDAAKKHTGREVFITIAADSPGTPNLLSDVTTPNVLISSAVRAAMESNFDKAMDLVLEKGFDRTIQKWVLADETPAHRTRRRARDHKNSIAPLLYQDRALDRAREIANIDHFIISQARPFVAPFTELSFSRAQAPRFLPGVRQWLRFSTGLFFLVHSEQFIRLAWAPMWLQKLLLDTRTKRPAVTIVPIFGLSDIRTLFRSPSKKTADHWMFLGQKSVWPCAAAIDVRCSRELALQRYADEMSQEDPREWILADVNDDYY